MPGQLIGIRTEDGITLDGAAWAPSGGGAQTGIALFPGTGAEFYTPWLSWVAPRLAEAGYPVVALNRRDHGSYFGFHKLEPAALDHRYAVDFLAERGAQKIVLGGHSYGTVTAPYYVMKTGDSRVAGFLLYAALGDLRQASVAITGGQAAYDRIVATARARIAAGQGLESFLIPPMAEGSLPIVHTHETFLDKRGPESKAVPADLIRQVGDRPLLAVRDPADPMPATMPPRPGSSRSRQPQPDLCPVGRHPRGEDGPSRAQFHGPEEAVLKITLDWLSANDLKP